MSSSFDKQIWWDNKINIHDINNDNQRVQLQNTRKSFFEKLKIEMPNKITLLSIY